MPALSFDVDVRGCRKKKAHAEEETGEMSEELKAEFAAVAEHGDTADLVCGMLPASKCAIFGQLCSLHRSCPSQRFARQWSAESAGFAAAGFPSTCVVARLCP